MMKNMDFILSFARSFASLFHVFRFVPFSLSFPFYFNQRQMLTADGAVTIVVAIVIVGVVAASAADVDAPSIFFFHFRLYKLIRLLSI